MKSYKGDHSIHLVGQAWQIRIMLKQWQQQWGSETMIVDIISKSSKNINENRSKN
ncbi:Z-ring formation inhibitor MciZ [Paenibacillus lautus]|uniref:Z-ring formation inhibitor MciZ n=1 Tax=Paenibacillus lautus TaxID=1401 RepID=UPI00384DDDFF